MSKVTIYHNPACGTSRNTLGLIRNAGIEPIIIEYLEHPPSREQLVAMIKAAGLTARDVLRKKGMTYVELGFGHESPSEDEILDAMVRHPKLINRPFVVSELGTRLCRPSELVLDILPQPQRGYFAKEDGEVVIDEQGRRVVAVREASSKDAEQIAGIYNYYIANTVITFEEEPVSESDMAARIAAVQNQGLPWLVAHLDGKVAGYCYASKWKTRAAYRHSVETTIYLMNGFEGRGIGRTLYSALLQLLRERGIHAVIGGAALPNPASVALHEKLGFSQVATFREVGFKHGRWVDVAYWEIVLPAP